MVEYPIQVPSYANIKLFLDRVNLMGVTIGDLDKLNQSFIDAQYDIDLQANNPAFDPNLVSALNSLVASTLDNNKKVLVRAIFMS